MRKSHPAARLLDEAGPTVSIPEAARALGISTWLAYEMAKRGELAEMGVRVLQLGSRKRVPTADLRRAVGLDHAEGIEPR